MLSSVNPSLHHIFHCCVPAEFDILSSFKGGCRGNEAVRSIPICVKNNSLFYGRDCKSLLTEHVTRRSPDYRICFTTLAAPIDKLAFVGQFLKDIPPIDPSADNNDAKHRQQQSAGVMS